jgi:DNA-binding NarL/FixJ family response regulator
MAGRKRKIRVLVVDNNPCVVRGIQAYFKTKHHISVVGQARGGEEAIEKTRKLSPDVVMMDLSLPSMNGMEALGSIRGEIRRVKLIAYTIRETKRSVRDAIRAGATGYVLKSSPLAMLVHAIERVHGGGTFLDPRIFPSLPLSSERNRLPAKQAKSGGSRGQDTYSLTQREREVLESLVDGLLIKEISERHHISPHTVVSHLRNIYNKFGVHKRSAAVTKALREHIV